MRFALSLLACCSMLMANASVALEFPAPEIKRDEAGTVTLQTSQPETMIRYTLDGSDPGAKAGPYLAPIALPAGGVVKARVYSQDRKKRGELAEAKIEPVQVKAVTSTLVPCTQDRDWPIYDWAQRHAEVSKITGEKKAELVFIGDSITQMFGGPPHDRNQPGKDVWEKYYARRNAANLGFGYDYVENTLWRLQHGELAGAKAKLVVIHIGTNNMGKNTPAEIVAGIDAIVAEVNKQQPQAKILLLAILPRGAKPDATRTKLADTNALLAKFAGTRNVTFFDSGSKFIQPDGTIPRELMGDYLHPTAKGYELWAETLEPLIAKLLGE